jgi:hypothetical protein
VLDELLFVELEVVEVDAVVDEVELTEVDIADCLPSFYRRDGGIP